MRNAIIQRVQRFLRERYNKTIVEIRDPFRDMRLLFAGFEVRGIVDGGSYHGEIAGRLLELFPQAKAYCFEPARDAFRVLKERSSADRRVVPINSALSSSEGTRTLFINLQDTTNALSSPASGVGKYYAWQMENVGTEEVALTTLDSWRSANGSPRIDLIKLDVQGHELEVLRGATETLRSGVRMVYCEVEFLRVYEENCLYHEVASFLEEMEFRLFQLYNLTTGDDGQVICGDAIFIKSDLLKF